MCGIAGYFGELGDGPHPRALLHRMISAIRHRGPDEEGTWYDRGVGFAHARLSIIDLAGGQQPMCSDDRGLCVTFNGEIFNYIELRKELETKGRAFRTHSDTESILRMYEERGCDCVEEFNGDFAFALWDRRRDQVMLARDRMGVRPLYYTFARGTLVFASEIKALLRFPGVRAELDPVALEQVFTFWFPLAPRTPFKDICELPPGHILVARRGGVTIRPYWRPTYPRADERPLGGRSEAEVAEELRELLIDATRIRLRADVPVGAYLSGGLDSSAITAMIRLFTSARLRTFSVGFEDGEFDETRYQQEVVRALRTDHQAITITAASIGESFPEVIRHAERPILRTAPAPLMALSQLVRDSGFKVVLTGEGADELLGGYDIFKEAKIRRFWASQPDSAIRPLLLRKLYSYLAGIQGQPQAYLEAFFRGGLGDPANPFFSHLPRWTMTARTKAFFSDDLRQTLQGYDSLEDLRGRLPAEFASWRPLSQAQYLETAYLLPGYILSSQGDRMSMAHAVEGRFPFLDHRVVDFASRIPPRIKLKGLREKHILKLSLARYLPATIVNRPKQPYRAPDSHSFFGAGELPYVTELLSRQAIARAGYFDPAAVEKLVAKCRGGAPLGFRDNMALVGILSVQLLDHLFVRNAEPCARDAVASAAT